MERLAWGSGAWRSDLVVHNLIGATVVLVGFLRVPYFFSYKTEIFSFQSNPKDLDPSCKMDLGLWDCLGMVKLIF